MGVFFRWLLGPFWMIVFGRAEAIRQATLLWTLTAAVERQFSVVNFLEALADEAGGRWRWKVRGLAELISAGVSIPDALEAMPGIVPADTVAMIRVGAQTGNLAGALREGAVISRRRSESPGVGFVGTIVYFWVLFGVLGSIATFVMIWIIPKFRAIFEGFEVEMPAITQSVITLSDVAANFWYLGFLFPLVVLWLWMAFASNLESMGWGPLWRQPLRTSFGYRPRFKTPHVLRCLSIAAAAGRPLAHALSAMAGRHPDMRLRVRMAALASEVERGDDCWSSLCGMGMLRPGEVAMLTAAQRVGNLAWALRGMADSLERKTEHRYQLVMEFVHPILTVAVGCVIGGFCVGMFMPLVELVRKLS